MDGDGRHRQREVADRIERVRGAMRDSGFERALLRWRRNFAWLTAGGDNHVVEGSEQGVAAVLVERDGARVLTSVIEAQRIRDEELAGLDLAVEAVPWETELEEAVATDGAFADDAALDAQLRPIRQVLNEREQGALGELGHEVTEALTAALEPTRVGETEADVESRLRAELALRGVRLPVFLIAADERNRRYRHPIPKRRPITESLMVVAVGERGGLNAAVTRMAWLRPPTEDERGRYTAIWDVYDGFVAATRPDATLGEVLSAGIAAYGRAGFPDEWQLHHQGGTIGYDSREEVATRRSTTRIETGMAFAWNPSLPGAKAEDTFVLTPGGPRFVTRDPRWPADGHGRPDILVLG